MESAVVNLTSLGEEVIVIVGGTFAKRWADIATAYGVSVHTTDVDWRRGATLAGVDRALKQWPNARVIFHTWSERLTGVLNDMAEIRELVRSQNKIFADDDVSGLAVSPIALEHWNIEVVDSGPQ